MDSVARVDGAGQAAVVTAGRQLRGFRAELFGCPGRRDELFELTDALLCAAGPVSSLVGLCLAPEHRRGHGALYDAVNHGTVDTARLRRVLAGLPLPRLFGGRIVLAVDASAWPRPDAATSPERLFCPVYGRTRESDQFLPGWPYRLVAALESGPTSGTALLGAVRLGPADEATAVTAARLRAVVDRLRTAGHWHVGERPMLVVLDAGYDWQAYLRRFDLDHTIRFEKQSLGWTRPKLRSPAAADRWTWLVLAAHTRLRLARPLAVDLRRPWERPLPPQRLTPARVRRGFRYLRAKAPCPASAPKPAHPGPGRPPGVSNRQGAIRYDVGKTTTQDTANKKNQQVRG